MWCVLAPVPRRRTPAHGVGDRKPAGAPCAQEVRDIIRVSRRRDDRRQYGWPSSARSTRWRRRRRSRSRSKTSAPGAIHLQKTALRCAGRGRRKNTPTGTSHRKRTAQSVEHALASSSSVPPAIDGGIIRPVTFGADAPSMPTHPCPRRHLLDAVTRVTAPGRRQERQVIGTGFFVNATTLALPASKALISEANVQRSRSTKNRAA